MKPNMSHAQARRALEAVASRSIPPAKREALEEHLAVCAGCRREAEELQALETSLRRTLHARLDSSPGPLTDPLASLPSAERMHTMKPALSLSFSLTLAILLLGVVLGITWLLPRSAAAPVEPPSTTTPAPRATLSSALPITTQVALPAGAPGLAVFGTTRDGNAEIYLLDAAGKKHNLTQRPAEDRLPVWSPDGQRIAFFSESLDTPGQREVFVMNADGSGLVQVTRTASGEGWLSFISWSPDGKRLALIHLTGVSEQNVQGVTFKDAQFYLANTDGSGGQPLTSDPRHGLPDEALWSPDGQSIALTRGMEDGGEELRLIRLGKPGEVELFSSPLRLAGLAWSPDSTRLAFLASGPWIADNGPYRLAEGAKARLYVQSLPDGKAQAIYEMDPPPAGLQLLGWAPDGLRLLYTMNEGAEDCWQIRSIRRDGSDPVTLPFCAALLAGKPVWTEDGWLLAPSQVAGDGQDYAVFALNLVEPPDIRRLAAIRLVDRAQLSIRPGLRMDSLSTYILPTPIPEPVPIQASGPGSLVTPPEPVCREASQALSLQLGLAVEVSLNAPFNILDSSGGLPTETGRSCEIHWSGPMSYAGLQEVFDRLTPWILSTQKYQPVSVGTGFRHWWGTYRQSYRLAQLEAFWEPVDLQACPDQDRAANCPLPAGQKRLEVYLRLADDPLTQGIDQTLNQMFDRLKAGDARALDSLSPALDQELIDLAGLRKALDLPAAVDKLEFTFEVRSAGKDHATVILTLWQQVGRERDWLSERQVDLSRQAAGWEIDTMQLSPP